MQRVTVDEMQQNLLKYLNLVEAGESFIIIQQDKAIAELKPIQNHNKQQRPFALCAGEFKVPGNFDAPLPDEILNRFEGR
ncbi:prevent-host-death protein [Nostoc sp. T09]|uniref:type II toxin-antitoxin system Phd/YefM family antitoxin n=1 Tax=Nostoc sp. T09 TaxID=1932621 RepID=UPI000A35D9B6|nr:prevent-host-death protein [Nostoc sp. T09]OUL17741.1 prevent-host-death protein [Nostoc sp. T09]